MEATGRGRQWIWAPLACWVAAYLMCVAAPLRPQTSDSTPGFLGAVTLACHGDQNLARIPWVDASVRTNPVPYWAVITPDGRALVSTFGPAPAWLGRPMLIGLQPGQIVEETAIRGRVRHMCALAIGTTAAFACLAAMAWTPWWTAVIVALLGACSFAGAPTLGQALWQQTAALPLLMAGCAAAAWAGRSRPAAVLAPAAIVCAALVRPVDAPLGLAIGVTWMLALRERKKEQVSREIVWSLVTVLLVALVAVPIVLWNLENLGTLLPSGQWIRNQAQTERVFDLSPAHIAGALAGLMVSPARGLLWFAPIAVVGVALALGGRTGAMTRITARVLAIGVLAQVLVTAAFFRWWGGVSFGPRLLAGATWVALVLAAAHAAELGVRMRVAWRGAAALTAVIGLLGTLGWDPAQWEFPAQPDSHPERLWQVKDTPLLWLFTPPRWQNARRVGPDKTIFCPQGASGQYSLGRTRSE